MRTLRETDLKKECRLLVAGCARMAGKFIRERDDMGVRDHAFGGF